jgi:hypothetical protein
MTTPAPPYHLQRQWINACPTFADFRPFAVAPVRVGTDWAGVITLAAAWGYEQATIRNLQIVEPTELW